MKLITYDQSKCDNCGACQIVCSLEKKGKFVPGEARIHIETAGGLDSMRAVVCQHCAEPMCVTACMRGIIHKDPETGKVTRNYEDCFRCAACNAMCPVGAAVLDNDLEAFITCDFCDGDPLCVAVCPTKALRYEDVHEVSEDRRTQFAKMSLGNPGMLVGVAAQNHAPEIDETERWKDVSAKLKERGISARPSQLKSWSERIKKAQAKEVE